MKEMAMGTLYTINFERIGQIEYTEMEDCIYIKENEYLSGELPEKVFLLQEYAKFPFLISLERVAAQEGATEEEDIEAEIVGKRIIVRKHENIRADVRIPISLEMQIYNSTFTEPKTVTVHNLSASGLLFASDDVLDLGMDVLCNLPISDPPLSLLAVIKNKIPMKTEKGKETIGYGCMFLSTDPRVESQVRSYVFKQQLDARKCGER